MSFYQKVVAIGEKYISKHVLFKYGFNLSPMYRRSTGRITRVSDDLLTVEVKLAISWKNKNYVNSIFGGSMFSAVDPIPMVQLINLLGDNYVVWDKAAVINFKRPAKEHIYAEFSYSTEEIEEIKSRIEKENEIEIFKTTLLTNKEKSITFCTVKKTIYIASKSYYKEKRKNKNS